MLGTSDAWSMSRLSHRPSKPAYYIEDCRILGRIIKNSGYSGVTLALRGLGGPGDQEESRVLEI